MAQESLWHFRSLFSEFHPNWSWQKCCYWALNSVVFFLMQGFDDNRHFPNDYPVRHNKAGITTGI